jgi:uncharacterized protein
MELKREDVVSRLLLHNQELTEHYGIASMYLFGSVARDKAYTGSDVDLPVDFKKPIGLFEFIELQQKLESILGCKVDLGTRRSLKMNLKSQVYRDAIRVA